MWPAIIGGLLSMPGMIKGFIDGDEKTERGNMGYRPPQKALPGTFMAAANAKTPDSMPMQPLAPQATSIGYPDGPQAKRLSQLLYRGA